MGKIVVPTGYMGSGSSAVTDLISEIEGYDADTGTFEYVFLHCPDGVFDLEDKLLYGNNAVRSDEALHHFRKRMKQLFDKKYWWAGHYNERLTPRFMEYTEEYISSLIQYRPEYYWYYQENADARMICRLLWKRMASLLSMGRMQTKKPLAYNDMVLSYIAPEEFYENTRSYLKRIWEDLGISERNVILDQLLLPFNLFRIEDYFGPEEIRVFVVERDPRDVYIINKYIWARNQEPVPYPTDVDEFCRCYASLRKMEKAASHPGIMRVRFEDLVYHYEETVSKILEHLGEDEKRHTGRKTKFIPEASIENTQLYISKPEFYEEGKVIEERLEQYLYSFPYERKADYKKTF